MKTKTLVIVTVIGLAAFQVKATIQQVVGAGSAVSTVDRSANFNSILYGDDLSNYTENLLSVTTPGVAYTCTPEFWDPFYGRGDGSVFYTRQGGNYSWVTIKTTDGKPMVGVEFLYGNGWDWPAATIDWEAYVGATLVSSGSTAQALGTILGFKDAAGFDSLLVRAGYSSPGDENIILDNLRVQLSAVPEPSTVALLVLPLGLQGIRHLRNRRS